MKTRTTLKQAAGAAILLGTLVLIASCSFGGNLLAEVDEQVRTATGQATNELTIGASGAGSVSPNGMVTVAERESIDIVATPDGGYNFLRWEKVGGTGEVVFGNATQAATTVGLTGGSATIQAVFTADSYQLTVTDDGNGSTTPAGALTVNHGVAESISASADTGYEFVNWTVTSGTATIDDPNATTTTVTLTSGNATVQANFQLLTYTLTINNDGNGSSTSSSTVEHGVPKNIIASPNRFYSFDEWAKTGGSGVVSFADSTDRSTQVTVTGGNATIEARFNVTTYSLVKRGNLYLNVVGYIETAYDIEVDGNYVYLAGQSTNNEGTIMRIDVTNKFTPSVSLSNKDTISGSTGRVSGIAMDSDYIYAADYYNGFYRFNKSDLSVDDSTASYDLVDVALHGSNPSFALGLSRNDRVVSYYLGSSVSSGSYVDLPGRGNRIQTVGGNAFVTAANAGGDYGEFHSIDASDPYNQGAMSVFDTVSAPQSGGLGDQPGNFLVYDSEYAYLASSNDALTHLWVDDPSSLPAVTDLSMSSNGPVALDSVFLYDSSTYSKELLVTASKDSGGSYSIVDIAIWSDPQVVGTTAVAYDGPEVMVVDGNYVYAYEDAGGATDQFVVYEIVVDP